MRRIFSCRSALSASSFSLRCAASSAALGLTGSTLTALPAPAGCPRRLGPCTGFPASREGFPSTGVPKPVRAGAGGGCCLCPCFTASRRCLITSMRRARSAALASSWRRAALAASSALTLTGALPAAGGGTASAAALTSGTNDDTPVTMFPLLAVDGVSPSSAWLPTATPSSPWLSASPWICACSCSSAAGAGAGTSALAVAPGCAVSTGDPKPPVSSGGVSGTTSPCCSC
mmetsp:Transcript_37932/g.98458  ORF Transcript_37932/g.98458 Transcript_37932/m.98458 type:complete len:231 (+) Transcript_37932:665-1357(+)